MVWFCLRETNHSSEISVDLHNTEAIGLFDSKSDIYSSASVDGLVQKKLCDIWFRKTEKMQLNVNSVRGMKVHTQVCKPLRVNIDDRKQRPICFLFRLI